MIAVTDVAYQDDVARAACVLAEGWSSQFAVRAFTALRTPVEDYVPGEFWRRELPVLLALLDGVVTDVVVVDGYVWLDEAGRPGLGARLHEALGVPVVGVAKRPFHGGDFAIKVHRGTSHKPLYVTAAGLDPEEAARAVAGMHGAHRIPTLLAHADRLAREGVLPATRT